MAQDNLQRFTDTILQGMMPSISKQRKGMFDFLLQMAQRQGTGGALQQIQRGLQPFAEEAGEAAARAGVQASRQAQQQEQFDAQQAAQQAAQQQAQSNFEKQFAAQQEQQRLANLLATQQAGGGQFSPELLAAMGYGPELFGGGGSGINAGFNRPNPALERLGLQGNQSFGNSLFQGGGGGGAASGFSTPSNPFRRVTGAGQGPGLMTPRPT